MIDEIYLNMKEIGYVPDIKEWDDIAVILEDNFLTVQERKYYLGKLFLAENDYFEEMEEQELEVPRAGEREEWICKQYGINKTNLKQYVRFAIGVDAVADIIPEFKSLILRLSEEVSEKYLNDIARLSPVTRRMIRENINRRKLIVRPQGHISQNGKKRKEFLVLQIE